MNGQLVNYNVSGFGAGAKLNGFENFCRKPVQINGVPGQLLVETWYRFDNGNPFLVFSGQLDDGREITAPLSSLNDKPIDQVVPPPTPTSFPLKIKNQEGAEIVQINGQNMEVLEQLKASDGTPLLRLNVFYTLAEKDTTVDGGSNKRRIFYSQKDGSAYEVVTRYDGRLVRTKFLPETKRIDQRIPFVYYPADRLDDPAENGLQEQQNFDGRSLPANRPLCPYNLDNLEISIGPDRKNPKHSRLIQQFSGHLSSISSVEIAAKDDRLGLISISDDRRIRLQNLKTGQAQGFRMKRGHRPIRFSPIDRRVLVTAEKNSVSLWNLEKGTITRSLPNPAAGAKAVFTPDGQTLITSSGNDIKVWAVNSGQLKQTLSRHKGYISALAVSPDGQTLVSGSEDNTAIVWSLKTGTPIRTLTGYKVMSAGAARSIAAIAFSPDGKWLFTGGAYDKESLKMWDTKTGQLLRSFPPNTPNVDGYNTNAIAISADNSLLATSEFYTIYVRDLKTGQVKYTLSQDAYHGIQALGFSPDGKLLASGDVFGLVSVWSLQ